MFAGNRHDATTLEQRVEHLEELYGRARRIWVMDRGMVSEDSVEFLRQRQRLKKEGLLDSHFSETGVIGPGEP